jgi:hypothetical protein
LFVQEQLVLLLDGVVEQLPVLTEGREFLLSQFETALELVHVTYQKGDLVFEFVNPCSLQFVFISKLSIFLFVRVHNSRLFLLKLTVVFFFGLHQLEVVFFDLPLLLFQFLEGFLELGMFLLVTRVVLLQLSHLLQLCQQVGCVCLQFLNLLALFLQITLQ